MFKMIHLIEGTLQPQSHVELSQLSLDKLIPAVFCSTVMQKKF